MKIIRSKIIKITLALVFLITAVPFPEAAEPVQAAVKLSNPKVEFLNGYYNTTWDCIWFGSYPQTEVMTKEMLQTLAYNLDEGKESFITGNSVPLDNIKVDDSLYLELQEADGWSKSGDITIRGTKYHRMKWKDTAAAKLYFNKSLGGTEAYDKKSEHWENGKSYHYFIYEPIKWRVLSTDGKKALLLSDLALDSFGYRKKTSAKWSLDKKWENSIFRDWLNGYKTSADKKVCMTQGNFIDTAFTKKEQKKIAVTKLVNEDNRSDGTDAGKNTKDKIFLLAETDIFRSNGAADRASLYGFGYDSFSGSRDALMSGYAAASRDTGYEAVWLTRTPDNYGQLLVDGEGDEDSDLQMKTQGNFAIRPAITLDLSSNKLWNYAGTVRSDFRNRNYYYRQLWGESYTEYYDTPDNKTGQIAITGSTDKLLAGKKLKLGIIELPSGSKGNNIVWSTSNKKYATVSEKGVVQAKKAGIGKTVTITARMKGKNHIKATCKIKIVKDAVKSIKISSKKGKKVIEGTTIKLSAKVRTTGKTAGKALNWSSSNEAYAVVSPSGTVAAKHAGVGKTVTITAEAADQSGVSAKYKLTITKDTIQKVELLSPKVQDINYKGSATIKVKVTRKSGVVTGKKAWRLLDWDHSENAYFYTSGTIKTARSAKEGETITATGTVGKKKVTAKFKVTSKQKK